MSNQQTFFRVRFMGETSENFEGITGMRQGDALSPVRFNLVLEKVTRDIQEEQKMEIIRVNKLLVYADIVILETYSRKTLNKRQSNYSNIIWVYY